MTISIGTRARIAARRERLRLMAMQSQQSYTDVHNARGETVVRIRDIYLRLEKMAECVAELTSLFVRHCEDEEAREEVRDLLRRASEHNLRVVAPFHPTAPEKKT
jgi:hypothetical protein